MGSRKNKPGPKPKAFELYERDSNQRIALYMCKSRDLRLPKFERQKWKARACAQKKRLIKRRKMEASNTRALIGKADQIERRIL